VFVACQLSEGRLDVTGGGLCRDTQNVIKISHGAQIARNASFAQLSKRCIGLGLLYDQPGTIGLTAGPPLCYLGLAIHGDRGLKIPAVLAFSRFIGIGGYN